MSDRERLCRAVKLIAWGYILIYLHFNLGTLDILPNWLGYVLMLQALPALSEEERSANLLRPLGTSLVVWEAVLWAAAVFGIDIQTGTVGTIFNIVGYVITVISMYFHFQLLTNLANAAEKYECSQSRRIIRLRTVNTVLLLVLNLPLPWYEIEAVAVILLIAMLIVTIWQCCVLFSLKKELEGAILE